MHTSNNRYNAWDNHQYLKRMEIFSREWEYIKRILTSPPAREIEVNSVEPTYQRTEEPG